MDMAKTPDTVFINVLKGSRVIMAKNIIPCQELFDRFKELKVFPDTMLSEIQACSTTEEKNCKMVDMLLVRGKQVMQPFTDALHLSGHRFLADFLKDEMELAEGGQQTQVEIDRRHLNKKVPRLDMILPDKEKEELITYIRNRVKEEVVSDGWRKTRDAEKVLNVRQTQLEQSAMYKEVLKAKDNKIQELQTNVDEAVTDAKNKKLEIKHLSNYIEELSTKHKKDLDTQMHFNTANDKSLQRMTEKDYETTNKIEDMICMMENCIKNNKEDGGTERDQEENMLNKYKHQSNPLAKAKATVEKMLELVEYLVNIKTFCHQLQEERRVILVHLGIHNEKKDNDVLGIFRKYVVDNQERMDTLHHRIEELESTIEEKTEAMNSNEESYKRVIETLTSDVTSKDGILKRLNEENRRLNRLIMNMHADKDLQSNPSMSRRGSLANTITDQHDTNNAAAGLTMNSNKNKTVHTFKYQVATKPKDTKYTGHQQPVVSNTNTQITPMQTFSRGAAAFTVSSVTKGYGNYKHAFDTSNSSAALPPLNQGATYANASPRNSAVFKYRK